MSQGAWPALMVADYFATEQFRAVPAHTAVTRASDDAVVAITGPLGDPESERYARLFAAAPNLLEALLGLLHPGRHEGECDNPNGGACTKHLIAAWGREDVAREAIAKALGVSIDEVPS